jgi:hypothetical protein
MPLERCHFQGTKLSSSQACGRGVTGRDVVRARARSRRWRRAYLCASVLGLAASGCGPDTGLGGLSSALSDAGGAVSTPSPTVFAATSGDVLSLVVPAGVSPQDVAISAGELDIDPRASVVRVGEGFAPVASFQDRPHSHGAGESAEIDGAVGNLWSAGAVDLGRHAFVHGFLKSSGEVDAHRGSHVSGEVEANSAVPFRLIERAVPVSDESNEDVSVRASEDRSLEPAWTSKCGQSFSKARPA